MLSSNFAKHDHDHIGAGGAAGSGGDTSKDIHLHMTEEEHHPAAAGRDTMKEMDLHMTEEEHHGIPDKMPLSRTGAWSTEKGIIQTHRYNFSGKGEADIISITLQWTVSSLGFVGLNTALPLSNESHVLMRLSHTLCYLQRQTGGRREAPAICSATDYVWIAGTTSSNSYRFYRHNNIYYK